MPFWRKKQDGFEWNKYVRTTVLMRRKARRQKLEDAGAAAVFGVRQAQWKSAAWMKKAGIAAGRGTVSGARAVGRGSKASWQYLKPRLKNGLSHSRQGVKHGLLLSRQKISAGARNSGQFYLESVSPRLKSASVYVNRHTTPLRDRLSQPNLFGPLAILTLVTAIGALVQIISTGWTQETLWVTGLALSLFGLMVLAWPRGLNVSFNWPEVRGNSIQDASRSRAAKLGLAIAAIAAVIGGTVWAYPSSVSQYLTLPALPKMPEVALPDIVPNIEVSAINPFKKERVEGRALAEDGGHIKIGKRLIRLDDIEALMPAQTCKTARGRTWRCGRSAKANLYRIIRRKTITCEITGKTNSGIDLANCKAGDKDVAGQLVGLGYAFSEQGIFAQYSNEENQARENKRGLWQGSALRPQDFRDNVWKKAAERAPDGCPIKGRVIRRKKLYALPWDSGYDRARIRERRGEKWFCSEQDAIAAGFTPLNKI